MSGAVAGLGGALLAHRIGRASPIDWDFNLALLFVIMTVVGGLRSRAGVVIGSAFFALIGYLLDKFSILQDGLNAIPGAPDLSKEFVPFVVGPLLLLLTLTMFPGGIGQQIRPLVGWLRGGRFDLKDRGPKEVQISDVRA
jgi:branched-chain amino acid transport system permease protein